MVTSREKITRTFQGIVVSASMNKTIVAKVDTMKWHKKYHTQYRMSEKYKIHDEKDNAEVGNVVEFVECRPLSKEKRWRLTKIVK